ncbi:MAG: hypothetical protein KatS3mg014_2340 [Actinomycetota bacterium]|nr:MAG: hypothetical protein KatS3mg014_2340 [Actinomycetota bacterium]
MQLDQRHQRALVNAVVAAATTAILGLIVVSLLPSGEGATGARPSPTAAGPSPLGSCEPSWDRVPSPTPEDGGALLADVAVVAPDLAWAVGGSGDPVEPRTTLAIVWNGAEWDLVITPNAGSLGNRFDAVDALSPDAAWAVGRASSGTGAIPIAAQWDGGSWTLLPSSPDVPEGAFLGVEAITTDEVWAVGYAGDPELGTERAVALRWNGFEWTSSPLRDAIGGGRSALVAIAGTSGSDLWAVGYHRARPMILHFDGSTWTPSSSDVRGSVLGVVALAPDDAWIVGERIQRFDGTAWTEVAAPRRPGVTLRAVAAVSPTDVWAVGSRPNPDGVLKPLVLRWDGSAWSRVPGRGVVGAVALTGVGALPDGTVLGVGYRDGPEGRTTFALRGTTCVAA